MSWWCLTYCSNSDMLIRIELWRKRVLCEFKVCIENSYMPGCNFSNPGRQILLFTNSVMSWFFFFSPELLNQTYSELKNFEYNSGQDAELKKKGDYKIKTPLSLPIISLFYLSPKRRATLCTPTRSVQDFSLQKLTGLRERIYTYWQ